MPLLIHAGAVSHPRARDLIHPRVAAIARARGKPAPLSTEPRAETFRPSGNRLHGERPWDARLQVASLHAVTSDAFVLLSALLSIFQNLSEPPILDHRATRGWPLFRASRQRCRFAIAPCDLCFDL